MEEVLGRNYLMLLSDLLVFHFTNYSLKKILKDKPNYDLPEVSGIKGFIENNMGSYQSLLRIQEAIPVLRVQKGTRECLRLAFSKVDAKNICFSMLFCNGKIIMTKRQKNFYPCPPDLVLLMENITIAALQSTEDAEIWMPVCLPRYNKNGFLYLYGVFLTRKLGIACLTLDKEGFANCSQFSKEIKQKVLQLKEIESLSASIRSDPFHLVETGIPGLLHFLYKSKQFLQIVMPKNTAPYSYKTDWKRLLQTYQSFAVKLNQSQINWIFHKGEKESILALQNVSHELYIVLGPLTTLELALDVHGRLLSWLKLEQESLFLISSPIF